MWNFPSDLADELSAFYLATADPAQSAREETSVSGLGTANTLEESTSVASGSATSSSTMERSSASSAATDTGQKDKRPQTLLKDKKEKKLKTVIMRVMLTCCLCCAWGLGCDSIEKVFEKCDLKS